MKFVEFNGHRINPTRVRFVTVVQSPPGGGHVLVSMDCGHKLSRTYPSLEEAKSECEALADRIADEISTLDFILPEDAE